MKIFDGNVYLTLTEVSQLIGKTKLTILRWYEYEATLPESDRILPRFIEWGGNNTKFVLQSEIDRFNQFKTAHSKGDMNVITSKYNGVNKASH